MKQQKETKRPQYMNKLNRKQCGAIARARTRMITAKANHKNQYGEHLQCRHCNTGEESQKHILTECTHLHPKGPKIGYRDLFQNQDLEKLRTAAAHIMDLEKRTEEATSPWNKVRNGSKTSYSNGYPKTKCMKRTNVIHSGGSNNQSTPTNVLLTNHVQNSLLPNHS